MIAWLPPSGCLNGLPPAGQHGYNRRRGRGGGVATTRAARMEGKRMNQILTLLILLLQVLKAVLDYLNR